MVGVGIGYIFMGLVPYVVKKLNGQLKPEVTKMHTGFLYCGISILILYTIGLLLRLDANYRTMLAVLPVLVFAPFILAFVRNVFNTAKTTD